MCVCVCVFMSSYTFTCVDTLVRNGSEARLVHLRGVGAAADVGLRLAQGDPLAC